MQKLYCYNNNLTTLDVSCCTALQDLRCNNNNLTTLDVSGCTALQTLRCYNNNLTTLDVSGCTALTLLDCRVNNLLALDLSNNPNITSLSTTSDPVFLDDEIIDGFSYVPLSSLTAYSFDKSRLADQSLIATIGETEYLRLGECASEESRTALTYTYNTGNGNFPTVEFTIKRKPDIPDVEISEANFPDPIFRSYIQENFDTNGDYVLSADEILNVTDITVYGKGIGTLQGIEYFIELANLFCDSNNLTSLDISRCTELQFFSCTDNHLVALDLSNNPNISMTASGNGNTFDDVLIGGKSYVPLSTLAAYGFDKTRLVDQSLIATVGGTEYLCLGDCPSADMELSLPYQYNTGNSNYPAVEFTISRNASALKEVTLNAFGYATYSNSETVTISGAEAYTATIDEESEVLWLTPIGNVVPANTGVLLMGEASTKATPTLGGEAPAVEQNALVATVTATEVTEDSNPYVLSGDKFVRFTGTSYSPNRAHIEMSADSGTESNAKQMTIMIGKPSAIHDIDAKKTYPADAPAYDLRGMRVNGKAKGIVIVNGKRPLLTSPKGRNREVKR